MSGRLPNTGQRAASGAFAKPRLLVVDDLEDNRILLSRGLARRGFEVAEAAGGVEALARLAAEPFDLVLLDIVMPDLDGFDTLARIREQFDAAELPVIMATIRDGSADVVRALRMGANDYIAKPIDLAIVEARIETQLERKLAVEQARREQPELLSLVAELRAAVKQAEATTRAKSDFLANMSHEIRTPLNGILGMASVLGESEAREPQRKIIQTIVESAEGLERLLSDALDMSKVEAGKLEVRREAFDLARVVERSAELFRASATAKGLSYNLDIADAARIHALGDPLRLQQILTNLLSNAVKFTADGHVDCLVTREEAAGDFMFEVRDSGIGFEPARAEELFGRFIQADGAIVERFGGSGLGLAISRRLAELMGGRLTATSVPGEGAVFTLRLPLPVSAPPRAAPAPAMGPFGRPLRVLAADDHVVNRRLLELMLAPLGVELTLVENGAQALEAFGAQAFDAVLMDVQMPVMDGLSAIRALRQREAKRRRPRTPVIALSAHALREHVQQSLDAGADRHVTKPVTAQVLLAALGELIEAGKPAKSRRRARVSG